MHVPTKGERREHAPFVVSAETGRAVATHGELSHVTLVIVIIGTGEVGSKAMLGIVGAVHAHTAVFCKTGSIVDVGLRILVLGEIHAGTTELLSGITIGTLADDGGDTVFAYGLVIGKHVLKLPSQVMGAVGVGIGVLGLVVAT